MRKYCPFSSAGRSQFGLSSQNQKVFKHQIQLENKQDFLFIQQ